MYVFGCFALATLLVYAATAPFLVSSVPAFGLQPFYIIKSYSSPQHGKALDDGESQKERTEYTFCTEARPWQQRRQQRQQQRAL